jgi:hypothetical protein
MSSLSHRDPLHTSMPLTAARGRQGHDGTSQATKAEEHAGRVPLCKWFKQQMFKDTWNAQPEAEKRARISEREQRSESL